MRFPGARLLVFAKAPQPGAVMTRLHDTLGAAGAARLHAALVRHTVDLACRADLCPVELWCAPGAEHPFFDRCARDFDIALRCQEGADLGERMHHALANAVQRSDCAMVMGCDCPSLTPADLQEALQCLHEGSDAVVAPAEDGGYVLLGLRRTHPGLFIDVPWGTDRVMTVTRRRMEQLQWRWRELAVQWDVDRPQDLQRLAATDLEWEKGGERLTPVSSVDETGSTRACRSPRYGTSRED